MNNRNINFFELSFEFLNSNRSFGSEILRRHGRGQRKVTEVEFTVKEVGDPESVSGS